jgi:hypothetical protein
MSLLKTQALILQTAEPGLGFHGINGALRPQTLRAEDRNRSFLRNRPPFMIERRVDPRVRRTRLAPHVGVSVA